MSRDESRMMVNVFETIGHAERAVAALLVNGYHAGQIAIVETAQEASGLSAALARHGIPGIWRSTTKASCAPGVC